ncbi:MAG TPA: TIGR02266 family protein [Anaeromyxobacteraceae bacterium]|nr:TIGR02266 family protein [Anaeromyxobacteraceae bacterium]
MESPEKRKDLRVPLILRIEYPASASLARDVSENLSAGGLFIRSDRVLPPGERVPLQLSFPSLLDPFEIEVEVVWSREAGPAGPAGVAVRLPDGREADRDKLSELVSRWLSAEPAVRSYRVLVVEDNPHVVEMYEWALKKLRAPAGQVEIQVEYAPHGLAALSRVAQSPKIDLVLTDLFMPVMDGFTLIERLRSDPSLADLPILVVSGGGPRARERASQLGIDVFLYKPFQFTDILNTVRALLRIQG